MSRRSVEFGRCCNHHTSLCFCYEFLPVRIGYRLRAEFDGGSDFSDQQQSSRGPSFVSMVSSYQLVSAVSHLPYMSFIFLYGSVSRCSCASANSLLILAFLTLMTPIKSNGQTCYWASKVARSSPKAYRVVLSGIILGHVAECITFTRATQATEQRVESRSRPKQ